MCGDGHPQNQEAPQLREGWLPAESRCAALLPARGRCLSHLERGLAEGRGLARVCRGLRLAEMLHQLISPFS